MSNDTFPSFCNHDEWNTQLEILVKSLLPDESSKKADELYTLLKNCYNTGAELREIILGNEISSTIFPKFQYCDLLTKATHIGLDIPAYFNYKHCQPIIMIVGIDPLRTGDQLKSTISVGSPYALHSKSFRSLKNLYWNLVNTLAQRKYTIYLTDTFKLYFKQNNKESHDITEFIHPEKKNHDDVHQNIFAEEYKIIKPDLIVTLGNQPRMWFTEMKDGKIDYKNIYIYGSEKLYYQNTLVLPFMHLSARNINKEFMDVFNLINKPALINFYVEKIEAALIKKTTNKDNNA